MTGCRRTSVPRSGRWERSVRARTAQRGTGRSWRAPCGVTGSDHVGLGETAKRLGVALPLRGGHVRLGECRTDVGRVAEGLDDDDQFPALEKGQPTVSEVV